VVRGAAAEALARLRTEAARDALIAAVATTAHPRARRSVVRALGQFRHDELAGATLARVVEHGDPSYCVEAEACLALGRARGARAGELLREAAKRDSFLDVIRSYAYRGLAESRDEDAIPLLVEGFRYGRISHGRRAALGALAELARGRRDLIEREAREQLEELLRDRDFRVQSSALEALAVLGDPASLAALDDVVTRELDGRLRRRAREIARDIGDARAPSAEVGSLRDEVERLRGDAARLRERLDRIDAVENGGPGAKPAARTKAARGGRKAPAPARAAARPGKKKPPARTPKRGRR
jgi:aminopeptidase N